MKEIIKKIKDLGFDSYGVVYIGRERYLIVFKGYGYYRETDKNNFAVSPYYFSSNKAYFATKELVDYIIEIGYNATVENKIVYDELLEKCGAIRGKNNLFFIDGLGSLFCVHIIKTDAPIKEKHLKGIECIHCNRCIKACPMSALSTNGIDKDKCIRHKMDNIADTECRDKITTLLGCDKCQKCCPNNNTKAVEATYPQFAKEKILRGDMTGIAELVGKNMARKQRLMFQGMCRVANSKDCEYISNIENIEIKELEDVKKWCIEKLNNIDLRQGK